MKRYSIILFMIILSVSCMQKKIESTRPVNKESIKEVHELLDFLYSIQGKKMLSGQHNYGDGIRESTDSIFSITGKYPAIWGGDLSDIRSNYLNNQRVINQAIKQYKKGAIITLMSHHGRPFDKGSNEFLEHCQGEMSAEQWNEMITPGTKMHKMWQAKVDTIANALKQLHDLNIPVLWRPYHEMNGIWFWWGDKKGENGYQKLWKMMYERLVEHHKINNLIWVWNANAPRDWENDTAYSYELYYPGHEYVDILAADIYKKDYKQSHHDDLLELADGKLIALGEIGRVPEPEVINQQPQWAWFMIWAEFCWKYNEPEDLKAIYEHPNVITLDELKNIRTK